MKRIAILLFIILGSCLHARLIDSNEAHDLASAMLNHLDARGCIITGQSTLEHDSQILAYVMNLSPLGYIIVTADDRLPPVLAYSLTSSFMDPPATDSVLRDMIITDLQHRMSHVTSYTGEFITGHRQVRQNLSQARDPYRYEQWPPEGSTPSGGWLKSTWTQNAPYNDMCPMDMTTGIRSLAGCPAIAMGQIVNYHHTVNGTQFTDTDDYHHNYSGRNYWIDNDFATVGFPSFPQLNTYLDTLTAHYKYQHALTDTDKAALVFGCAVAATQVFTSQGSGTFSVNQAYAAYQRFRFNEAQLLLPDNPDLYQHIILNIQQAKPVHLAIESQDLSSGHNLVIDGYNTDEYYHLNFGYGGAYDGWYQLPDDLPFGLTLIEGVIVDIRPHQRFTVQPDTVVIASPLIPGVPVTVTVTDAYGWEDVMVEGIQFDPSFGDAEWEVQHDVLPWNLVPGDSIQFRFIPHTTGGTSGNYYSTNLRILFDYESVEVPFRYQSPLGTQDSNLPAPGMTLGNYPNPFRAGTSITFSLSDKGPVKLEICNIRGQVVRNMLTTAIQPGYQQVWWDGKDDRHQELGSGIYLARLTSGGQQHTRLLVHIR